MPRRVNPHLSQEFFDRIRDIFPPDHPAVRERMLTPMQEQVLPALMWLFDNSRNRAEGRSTVFAHVCILLAMQGETVELVDVTEHLLRRGHANRYFSGLVLDIVQKHYPGHIFEYRHTENTLSYRGQHPR